MYDMHVDRQSSYAVDVVVICVALPEKKTTALFAEKTTITTVIFCWGKGRWNKNIYLRGEKNGE